MTRNSRSSREPDELPIVWEADVVDTGAQVAEPGRQPYRPKIGLAVCLTTGMVGSSEPLNPEDSGPHLTIDALASLHRTTRTWPDVLRVKDAAIAAHVEAADLLPSVRIEIVRQLPALSLIAEDFARRLAVRENLPDALAVPGVRPEHLEGLARAVGELLRTRPWRLLGDESPIRLESPLLDPFARVAVITGALGDDTGVLMVGSEHDIEELAEDEEEFLEENTVWTLSFWPADSFAPEERKLLDRIGVTANDGELPALILSKPHGNVRRASPRMLQLFEALTRAFAELTEEDLLSGRWRRTVDTSQGPLALTLACPEAIAAQAVEPGAPDLGPAFVLERFSLIMETLAPELVTLPPSPSSAQLHAAVAGLPRTLRALDRPDLQARDLAMQALSAGGVTRRVLARRALELDPHATNAYVALSLEADTPEAAIALLDKAIETGRGNVPDQASLKEGAIADHPVAIPLLRSLFERGRVLMEEDRLDEATVMLREAVSIDRDDDIRAREVLALVALRQSRVDEARRCLKSYWDQESTSYLYTTALASFVEGGDEPKSRRCVTKAIRDNEATAFAILGSPLEAPEEVLDDEDSSWPFIEAGLHASMAAATWKAIPGALDWLEERLDAILAKDRARS